MCRENDMTNVSCTTEVYYGILEADCGILEVYYGILKVY